MDLEVIGRHALLFDDDSMAAFVNSPEALVDWNSLSIDRYDVRHLLSSPPPPRNRHLRRTNHRPPSSNTDDTLEADLDHERYLDLTSPSDHEQDLENEAAVENAGGYRAVPFSYGAPSESSEQKSIDAESSFHPPFTVPEHLLENLPPTEKVHQIIARTAMFVSKHGGQSEIVLRVKQGDNPTFGFLLPDHNLHPYFRFLVDHQELLKSDDERKLIKEENKFDGGLDQIGGALSLLGSVYGSGEDEDVGTEDALAPTKNDLKEAADADNVTVSQGLEQNNLSQNAAGKDEVLSKPPFPSLKERSHVIKRNHPISTFKSGSTSRVKKDGDSMSSVSSTINELQPPVCPSMSKVEPSVLEPPSDLKRVVDKIVEFILRNGKEFEAVLVQQDTKHGRFPFLLPSNQYHPYYLKALQKAQESRLAGKNFVSEKHEHGIEKKSGNKESDTVSLGSDIPCEYDRKEKFKMVIGKPKKDEKDPHSKATQPQVGVSVDAAAAAAILQAATKGIKNPSFEILSKTINSSGQVSTWSRGSNQKPDENEEAGVSGPVAKAIAKTAALVAASEADSSEASLTREEKLKAERLKRAKMFAAMIRTGAAPVKSESLRGLSVEPPESGLSGSDFQAIHLVGRERESNSAPMEVDTCDKIEKAAKKESADEQNERRSKRSYRSRSNRAEEEREEEEEEEEDLKEDRDHKHSRKKRRSHRSSHHSRDRHKHRKRHSSSQERESEHRHVQDSTSEDEYRHSRRRHRHDSSSDYEHRHSSRRHRHDSSPSDEHRHARRRHKHRGSSDDEQMHSRRSRRYGSSDDGHRHTHSQHQRKHGTSTDDEDRYQAKSVKHRKMSRSEREAELEEGEILTKSDQSKVSEGEDGASREPSVDLSKSSRRSEPTEVSNDLRAKIRAMLMATL